MDHMMLMISGALADSLWEGAIIAGAAALALRLLQGVGAATRYAMWFCVLISLVAVPVATVSFTAPRHAQPAPVVLTGSAASLPAADPAEKLPALPRNNIGETQAPAIANAVRPATIDVPRSAAAIAVLIWIAIAGWKLIALLLNVRELAELRANASPWPCRCEFPVLLSERVPVPLALGLIRPAVLLPQSLPDELQPEALEAVVLHEAAHLRRRDVWTNAIARVVHALVAFNPAAWYVMRKLSIEREIACDDCVVAGTGSGSVFAEVLAAMATHERFRPALAAPSMLGSRHSVMVRIEEILSEYPRRLRMSPQVLTGVVAAIALTALAMRSISPVFAYAHPAQQPASEHSGLVAAACSEPNRGVQIAGVSLDPQTMSQETVWASPADANAVAATFGRAHAALVSVTVGADGRAQRVSVISAPDEPGVRQYVTRLFMTHNYEPALKACVPVSATITTGIRLGTVLGQAMSIVTPVYAAGWSAQHANACKVPSLIHIGTPEFPRAASAVPIAQKYDASVRVNVDASGSATGVSLVSSSGNPAFDDALLRTAKVQRYPLLESTGFKPVRPDGAPLAWNSTHGSGRYSKCAPLPQQYVWHTSFYRTAPQGFPGSTADVLLIREP